MAQAEFRHGNPIMVDYTPSSSVSAGDVVVINNIPHVAHKDIAANTLGAVARRGGVYALTADASTIEPGDKVYWDDVNNKITEVDSSGDINSMFGYVTPDSDPGADGAEVIVEHNPDGTVI